ncbi:lysophospholipase [Dethiosulfatarculus sandiegensis]|uniref:Lysophospholipase n=1 Tax=Dethiosulfatarculus sandiegensis TaxID=1429043 RepID=A0A0D2JJN1_9BACT|nr:lysophospholipase [Dethiosulfatarculus sandiegensis]
MFLGVVSMGLNGIIDSFVFFPDKQLIGTPNDLEMDYRNLWITVEKEKIIHAWWVPAPDPGAVVLFCHGNAGNISHRLDNLAGLYRLGLSVLIFDYRGYGKSRGSASEEALYADARAACARAGELARQAAVPLVVFGRSLGGAAAVGLVEEPGISGMILESTFTNLADMAKVQYHLPWTGSWLAGRFNSLDRIKNARTPLLFIHGNQDYIVPFELGKRLFQAAPEPKEFIAIEGAGHNDTIETAGQAYYEKLAQFINSLKMVES